MKSTRYEIVGTETPLSGGKGIDSPSSDPRSGQFEMVGTHTHMSRKPIMSPSANPPEGSYEIMGTEVSLSRKAVKGWGDAAKLTMSPAMLEASNNAAERKGRRK